MNQIEKDNIHRKILFGEFAHYCPDFDYLAIDETYFEFQFCLCDYLHWDLDKKKQLQEELRNA